MAHKLVRLYWPNTHSEGVKLPSVLAAKQETSTGYIEFNGSGVRVDLVNSVGGRVTDLDR